MSLTDEVAIQRLKEINTAIEGAIDKKIIDKTLDLLAMAQVVLAQIIAFFDRNIIDGVPNGSGYLAGTIGKLTRSFQGGYVQKYIVTAILAMILLYWLAP